MLADQPLTTDEAATRLKRYFLSVRPRFSELRALGLIEPSGERRGTASGCPAAVWRLTGGPRPSGLPRALYQALDEAERRLRGQLAEAAQIAKTE